MHHGKLGLILILGSVSLLAVVATRKLASRSRLSPAPVPTALPPGRRLTNYHLLTPSRN